MRLTRGLIKEFLPKGNKKYKQLRKGELRWEKDY